MVGGTESGFQPKQSATPALGVAAVPYAFLQATTSWHLPLAVAVYHHKA